MSSAALLHPTRPYLFYADTVALCSTCLTRVLAKIVIEGDRVILHKRCLEHGPEQVLLADDVAYFRAAREVFLKPPEQPLRPNTGVVHGCPYDCGVCPEHEQHSCVSLLEITEHCNLSCPTCYASSSPETLRHLSLEQIRRMLDRIIQNEGHADVLQVSGGEPTIHPEFFEVLALARQLPIGHLMVNTNGVRIAVDEDFAARLADQGHGFEVYLQWDSHKEKALRSLRGADLTRVRARALERLNRHDISTTLVVTVQRGQNEDELGAIVEFAAQQPAVRGVTFQPTSYAGRVPDPDHTQRSRVTLTEIRRRIAEQTSLFSLEDLVPVPCNAEHIAMAYAFRTADGTLVPITRHVTPELLLAGPRSTITFEHDPALRGLVLNLLSTGHGPQGAARALGDLLCCLPQVDCPDGLSYKNVFRVVIAEFLDRYTMTLHGARKSCVHVAHPDGKRMIPLDLYNLLYRGDLERERLAPLRARRL